MPISKQEISCLLDKLREKYSKYALINSDWFNIQAFEDRYYMAVKNKMNLQAFLLAEIANFEKVKDTFEKKKTENEDKNSFSKKVDLIMEENYGRIKKYPKIEFHFDAGLEIMHLYGALSQFVLHYMPVFWIINLDEDQKQKMMDFENDLEYLALPIRGREAKRIEDHKLLLSRYGVRPIDIEADNNDYLKVGGFFLNELSSYTEDLLDEKCDDWMLPLNFSKLFIEGARKKGIIDIYSGCTSYGAILIVKNYIDGVIADFRLGAFKSKPQREEESEWRTLPEVDED
jgi:hypothetical protein